MSIWIEVVIATSLVSFLSLVGALGLVLGRQKIHRLSLFLVALAAGTMMGGAFFHLLPESVAHLSLKMANLTLMLGFIFFFLLEKIFYWHHCQTEVKPQTTRTTTHAPSQRNKKSLGYLNLLADLLHNFIDGLVIAVAFLADFNLGVTTTIAISLHEIPQELGDFGVLLHAGFTPFRALLLNFITAWSALLGAVIGLVFLPRSELTVYLLPLAAGGFLYIAAADLLPEMKEEKDKPTALGLFFTFIAGLAVMWYLV